MRPEDAPARTPVDPGRALSLLSEGVIEPLGRIPWASNATLLARVHDDDLDGLAIYKPLRGERPLWDFPAGLYRREVAAYLVSEALDWGLVPPTVARAEGPYGKGSLQLYVENDDGITAFELLERGHPTMPLVAAFDVVINNADRKGGHTLLGGDGRVWAIDHGVCFAAEPKLRTVIWEFVGEPLPERVAGDLAALPAKLAGDLGERLARLLHPDEVTALAQRAADLARRGTFPEPSSPRPYPWPLV
jgi:uncharacterized repeat protein (TIGR03843 family)